MNLPVIRTALVSIALGLAMLACAGAPVQEMSNARQVIMAAEQAGAAKRAPEPLAAARRWLEDAEQALNRGDYHQARDSATRARRYAREALETAQGGADRTSTGSQ